MRNWFRKYGILCIVILFILIWSTTVWFVAVHHTKKVVTETLSAQYETEYEARMVAFKEEVIALNTPTEDEVLAAQIKSEADCIARLIGPFATKQMKQTVIWNVLARVDSPFYPNTVDAVVNQADQWMFYSKTNPIRDDDVELVMEQLQKWHEGRYPKGFNNTLVYGAWSPNDYYLFDDWNKGFGTTVWRYEE